MKAITNNITTITIDKAKVDEIFSMASYTALYIVRGLLYIDRFRRRWQNKRRKSCCNVHILRHDHILRNVCKTGHDSHGNGCKRQSQPPSEAPPCTAYPERTTFEKECIMHEA